MSKSYARLRLAPGTVLGYRKDGRAIYPIAGGSQPTGNDAGGGNDSGNGSSTPASNAGTGASGSEGNNSNSQVNDPEKKIAALEEEKTRHYRARSEAEKRAEQAEAELKKIADKDKSELERATGRVQELETQNDKLQQQLDDLRLDNAILADSKHNWRDRRAVLRLLDRGEIEFRDGKPQGLENALKKLAQESPYLLAEEEKKNEDPGKGQPSTGKAPATRNGNAPSVDRDALARKYPGLRR
jgi:hypothetical protein